MKSDNKFILMLFGLMSGLATWPFMKYFPRESETYASGFLFGIFIALYFLFIYPVKPKIRNLLLWVVTSTLAYSLSYFIVYVSVFIDVSPLYWAIAGIFGAAVMSLGFNYFLLPLKKKFLIIFYVLGASIPIIYLMIHQPDHNNVTGYVPLYIEWNTIMAIVFAYSKDGNKFLGDNKNNVINPINKNRKFGKLDFFIILFTFISIIFLLFFLRTSVIKSDYEQSQITDIEGRVTSMPIDEEWEAIGIARHTPSEKLSAFMNKYGEYARRSIDDLDYSRGLEWSAKFYENGKYWQVITRPKNSTDIWYEIQVSPEGSIIYEQQVIGG